MSFYTLTFFVSYSFNHLSRYCRGTYEHMDTPFSKNYYSNPVYLIFSPEMSALNAFRLTVMKVLEIVIADMRENFKVPWESWAILAVSFVHSQAYAVKNHNIFFLIVLIKFTLKFINSFISHNFSSYSFIYLFMFPNFLNLFLSFICLFIRLFIYLFISLFIYLF